VPLLPEPGQDVRPWNPCTSLVPLLPLFPQKEDFRQISSVHLTPSPVRACSLQEYSAMKAPLREDLVFDPCVKKGYCIGILWRPTFSIPVQGRRNRRHVTDRPRSFFSFSFFPREGPYVAARFAAG